MNRLGSQMAVQAGWLGYCAMTPGLGWQEVMCGAIVASSMAADDWSPDADQGGWVAKIVPGGHRGPLHMPEVVAVGMYGLDRVLEGRGYDWFAHAAAIAWGIHLATDFVCGRIPFLILGGRRVGLGFKTGGLLERVLTFLLAVACVPLAWLALMPP
jgi:hypothetical protein